MNGRSVFLICLAAGLAANVNTAQASRLFISTTSSNVALINPLMVVAPDTTSTFYVYWQETAGDQLVALGHDIGSSNAIISRVSYTIDNPTVNNNARWDSATSGDGPVTYIVQDAKPFTFSPTLGTLGAADPTYDAASDTYRVGTVVFHADSVGTTQVGFLVGKFKIAFAGTNQVPALVNFGFGDAAVSGHTVGAVSTTAEAIITVMQPDLQHPWHNTNNPLDVNADGSVVPLDALIVINALNNQGPGPLTVPPVAPDTPPPFLDVTGDNSLAPLDALQIINFLNAQSGQSAAPAGDESLGVMRAAADYGIIRLVPEPSTFALAAPAACTLLWLLLSRVRLRRSA